MATRQTLQLEELSYEYELFRENQLLTHEQLNKFIRYFEDQDRLTRTCLIGVGLVCGLSARLKNNIITVSQGCAVTTDGDLLKLETTDYKFFKAYSNLTRGKGDPIYDPFFPPASTGTQVKLWELMVTDKVEVGTPPDGLANFKTIVGSDIDDMVALLYLEYYLSEPDDCTAIDCDHLGQLQNAKIKVLLISQQDMDKVINSEPTEIIADHIYKSYYEAYTKYFVLPELKAQRLPMTSLNTASLGALTKGYTNIVSNGTAALVGAIEDLYNTFQFILDPTKYFKIATIKSKLNTLLTSSVKPFQVQYLYDFYKDMMECYNEMKDTIYNAIYICCPDKYAFPKHIMLGIVNDDLGPKPPKYRHYFYPSPAVTKNKSYLSVVKSMFNRMVDMANGFTLPAQPTAVRVTPSVDADKQMEWRAIPFYYKNAAALRANWSYYRTMRGTDKNVLSYHGVEYGENATIKSPLDYDLDKNNFFRIEGHQGKKVQEAMEAILDIKENKSLPFDVVAVRMDEKLKMEINLEDFSCQFDDLNAVLNAWIVEQDCLYAKTVKYFSNFDNTGKNRLPIKTGGVKTSVATRFEAPSSALSKTAGTTQYSKTYSASSSAVSTNYTLPKATYTYQVDNTVNNNLSLEDDTVGVAFMMIQQDYIFQLGDAYIGMLMQIADQNDKIKLLTADQREIVYNIPVKIIARINDVTRYKPFEVKDLDTDVLNDYKNAIDTLCDESEASRTKAETIFAKTSWVKQGYEALYLSALVELTENCCAADKLKALMDEIESRKQKILESLSFANYAAQHTGLEHKAGVHRGGTFVLLYASVKTVTGKGSASASLEAAASSLSTKARVSKKAQRDITDYYSEDEDTFLLELVNQKEDVDAPVIIKEYITAQGLDINSITGKVKINYLISRANIFAAELAADQKDTVNNEMVVADFCIPYICCSDCPPLVFIMPKQKYSLALPKAIACSDDALLPFQKEPADGAVAASVGFEDTIITKDGTTFFDPSKVKETDFGKEISFTIDGQVTECKIKVVKHPVSKFSFQITEENADIIVVQYTNESDDATGKLYEYEWNFGDGTGVKKVNTKDPITITNKKSVFGTAKSFKVTLKAINGGCSNSSELTIPITTVAVKPNLVPESDRVCENVQVVNFKLIEPSTGVVKCKEVPGAINNDTGKYFFNPSKVPAAFKGIALHFTVNDQDVDATITVFSMPDATFAIDPDTVKLENDILSFVIVLHNPDAAVYGLFMNGVLINEKLGPDANGNISITDVNVKGLSGPVLFRLTASNGSDSPCEQSAKETTLNIPREVVTAKTCQDTVKTEIEGAHKSLNEVLKGVGNTLLVSHGKNLTNVFEIAIKNITTIDQVSTQSKILSPMKDVLPGIMSMKMDKAEDKAVASVILAFALLLIMDTVRCTQKLDPKMKGLEIDLLQTFLKGGSNIAPFFPGLDRRGGLSNFINEFAIALASKDKDILATTKEILKLLKASFPQ
jgi:hypothetical protein